MKEWISSRVVLATTLCLIFLTGCLDDIRYNMPCRIPTHVEEQDIIGKWQTTYRNYLNPDSPSTRVSGIETIVIKADHTYVQAFQSQDWDYVGMSQNWELIDNEGDGPKLMMYGLKYFANGIEYSNEPLDLTLQMPDQLVYQDLDSVEKNANLVVHYPDEGYVYLYPRTCLRKFALLQMVSGSGDPDDLTVHNPVFTRLAEQQ